MERQANTKRKIIHNPACLPLLPRSRKTGGREGIPDDWRRLPGAPDRQGAFLCSRTPSPSSGTLRIAPDESWVSQKKDSCFHFQHSDAFSSSFVKYRSRRDTQSTKNRSKEIRIAGIFFSIRSENEPLFHLEGGISGGQLPPCTLGDRHKVFISPHVLYVYSHPLFSTISIRILFSFVS